MITIAILLLPQFNTAIPTMSYESAYPAVSVEIGQPFDLKINQSAYFQSSELAIKFVNITEDSRCPSDVTCVWEGQASALVSFSGGKSAGNFTLTVRGSGNTDLSSKAVNGYLLRLVDVQPYPTSKQKISPSDYTARFVLSRDEGQAVSRGVLVKAVNYQNLENNATAVTAIISGWNVEKGTGAAVVFMQEHGASGSIFKRVLLKFIPSNANNCTQPNAECIDGQITQTDHNDTGGLIHLEIDNAKTKLLLTYSPSEGNVVQDALNVTGLKVWLKPVAAPGNSSTVALKEGERDGPLLVQKIYPDHIEGLNFIEYPIARGEGSPITLHIGEKASNGCTVALTLVKIENGTAIFVKTVDQNRPCPICWIQQALLLGHNDAGY